MSCFLRRTGRRLFLAPALLALLGLSACSRSHDAAERGRVRTDFESFRTAILDRHAERVVTYLPRDVSDYLDFLKSGNELTSPPAAAIAPISARTPEVSLLIRTALDRKVTPDLREHLSLQVLLQRIADRGLLNCREVRDLSLGPVVIQGGRASGELFFQGKPLPLRLPFVRETHVWKVDLLAMLPYAEVLMRLDRAVTGKTETQQVDQLVAPLPLL